MLRRMEDRIRKLCSEVVGERDPEKAREMTRQLRRELEDFIKVLRARAAEYPVIQERRLQGSKSII